VDHDINDLHLKPRDAMITVNMDGNDYRKLEQQYSDGDAAR